MKPPEQSPPPSGSGRPGRSVAGSRGAADRQSPTRASLLQWTLLLGAVVLLCAALVPATGAAAPSPGDGVSPAASAPAASGTPAPATSGVAAPAASGAPASTAPTLAAQADLDPGERESVDDSTEFPNSAVVQVRRDRNPEPRRDPDIGSGFVVTDRHVVTAAHVVVDADTKEPLPAEELAVVPGQNVEGQTETAPFGEAEVESVYLEANPYERGVAPAVEDLLESLGIDVERTACYTCDFAVLTLDRPVGEKTGSFDTAAPGWERGDVVAHAGYPSGHGADQLASKGTVSFPLGAYDSFSVLDVPAERGNSGGPVWLAGEEDTAVGFVEAASGEDVSATKYAGVLTQDRQAAIETVAAETGSAPERADLRLVDDAESWFPGTLPQVYPEYPTVEGDQGVVQPYVSVFNSAPHAAGRGEPDVPVHFYLRPLEPGSEPIEEPLCTDEIDLIGAYESARATCTASEFARYDHGKYLIVAEVDPHDEIPEYTEGLQRIDLPHALTIEKLEDWSVETVDAPETVEGGRSFDVDVALANEGSHGDAVEVTVDGGDHATCDDGPGTVEAAAGETAEFSVECTADAVHDEVTTVTLTVDGEPVTRTVELFQPQDARSTVHVTGLTITHPYGEDADFFEGQLSEVLDGGTITVEASVRNYGDHRAARELLLTQYVGESDGEIEYLDCVDEPWTPTVELAPGEETTVTRECRLPSGVSASHEGRIVTASVGTWFGDERTTTREYRLYGPVSPEFRVGPVSAHGQTRAGEPLEVRWYVRNTEGPGEQHVRATVGDEVVSEADVYLDYEERRVVYEEWVPAPGTRGDVDVVVESGGERSTETVTVEPQPFAVTVDAPDAATPGETVAVPVTVANEGGGADAHDVVVTAAGEQVLEREVTAEAGDERTVEVEWTVPEDAEGSLTVTAASETDEATASVDVGPACTEVDGRTVCDVNGDGRYRDFNADGSVTQTDVSEFFSVQHRDAYDRPEFDYNGDGDVNLADVIVLFESI